MCSLVKDNSRSFRQYLLDVSRVKSQSYYDRFFICCSSLMESATNRIKGFDKCSHVYVQSIFSGKRIFGSYFFSLIDVQRRFSRVIILITITILVLYTLFIICQVFYIDMSFFIFMYVVLVG